MVSRFWIIILILFLGNPSLPGQCDENLLINESFETVGPPCGPVPVGGLINGSFNQGCMTGWEAAWGTPSVCSFGPYDGNYFACLGANNEGFFQTLDLSPDSTYCLSFYIRRLNAGSGSLDVYLASGLVNQPMGNSGNPPITIQPSWQLLGSFPATSNNWEEIIIPAFMQIDPANTQLLFLDVPTGGLDVGIDDVKLSTPGSPDPNIGVEITCADQSGSTFTFQGSLNPIPPGFEDAQWVWSFGDGQSGTGQVVSHTYETFGQYEICLSVFLECGCEGTGCITFSYDQCVCACTVDSEPPLFINFNPGPVFIFDLEDIPDPQPPEITDCDPVAFLLLEESETGPPCNRTINYTWIASDLCGNTSEMTQIIIFEDTSPPQFIVPPSDLLLSCPDYMDEFLLWIDDFGGADVTDESGVFSLAADYNPIFSNGCGEIEVDFIATDICGFQSSMQAVFTYIDTDAPELLVSPQNLVFPCTGVVPDELELWLEGNAGAIATDGCGDISWSNDFSGFNDDTLSIYFEAADQCFNIISFSALIIQAEASETIFDTIYTCDIQAAGIDTVLQVNQSCSLYIVTNHIFIPPDLSFASTVVCEPILAGIDTIYFVNRFGCDSLYILTSVLAPSDTVEVDAFTCDPLAAGIDTTYLINRFGCDSLIILTSLIVPTDTVRVDTLTCDPMLSGADTTYFINRFGCDSLFILNTVFIPSDTILIEAFTCDSSAISTDTLFLAGVDGCDSVVISSILFTGDQFISEDQVIVCGQGINFSDTIQVQGNPCDSVFITNFLFVPIDTTLITMAVCNPADSGILSIVLSGSYGCDSIILINNIYSPVDTSMVTEYTCFGLDTVTEGLLVPDQFGCDSLLVLYYIFNVTPDTQFFQQTTCDTSLAGIAVEIIPGQYCDTVRQIETLWVPALITRDTQWLCLPPQIQVDTFFYSSSAGCDSLYIVEYLQRSPQVNVLATDETCAGLADASILVTSVDGGLPPYVFSFNGGPFDAIMEWNFLSPGEFTIVVQDAAMCRDTLAAIQLEAGSPITVDAGPDVIITRGDIVPIQIESAVDWTSVLWEAVDALQCPTCPVTFVGPISREQFVYVTIYSVAGCTATDSFGVFILGAVHYAVPNIFSPDLDGNNDYFFLSGPVSTLARYEMAIFDRWGNQVFEAKDIGINDPTGGWDGYFRKSPLNPGVFTFIIRIIEEGQSSEIISGNVTLVR